ncbi:MAG TPA: hypothetical protein H9803_05485 [Candidatus Ligilactobacillus excrementavium]|nr:hypothetical protein [Candidatus Ligilactobacillus excrementavium]
MKEQDAKLVINYMNMPIPNPYEHRAYQVKDIHRIKDGEFRIDLISLLDNKKANIKINLSDQRHLCKTFRYFWNQLGCNESEEDGKTSMKIDLNDLVGKSLLVVSEEFHIADDAEVAASLVSITVLDKLGVKLLVE